MISDQLRNARDYESAQGSLIAPGERPLFHLTPAVGWLNDPNGFSVYRGEYHLFYQYHPYSTQWGPMHWGHCKSRDLLRWEHLPAALAPDQPYDRDGCFSGSAVETPEGQHLLMYTARRLEDGKEVQTQCIALGNGETYQKLPANPVIASGQIPPGGSRQDFRDPKIWREGSRWYAVAVNRTEDNSGAVLRYISDDLEHWTLAGMLDRSANEWGGMWECPDFFQLEGQGVLIVSPLELKAPGPEFHDGPESVCILGRWDGQTFTRESIQSIDQGLDFYAPQTTLTPDGRRVLVGWMQAAGEPASFVPEGQKWFGQLTLPRELSVRDGRLIQRPVRELEQYRGQPSVNKRVRFSGTTSIPGVGGRTAQLQLRLCPDGEALCRSFTVRLAQGGPYRTELTWRPADGTLTLDRSRAGFDAPIIHRRELPLLRPGACLELDIILDRFSVELFINGGEQTMSATLYTPQEADGISFEAEGRIAMDLKHYILTTKKLFS